VRLGMEKKFILIRKKVAIKVLIQYLYQNN
jgi:hypothetical protein